MIRNFRNKMNEMLISTDMCNAANDIKLNGKDNEIRDIKLKYSGILVKVIYIY